MKTVNKSNLPMVIFIGGPSGTGKSYASKDLAKKIGHGYLELDKIHDQIKEVKQLKKFEHTILTKKVVATCIEQILKIKGVCVIDGGWLGVKKASNFENSYPDIFFPIYCGYPTADAEERLSLIRQGDEHWLKDVDKNDAIDWIEEQIEASPDYKREADNLGIEWIDFSDPSKGHSDLINIFI